MRNYYYLIKPGIVRGNLITGTAGYFLAAGRQFDLWIYLATIVGLGMVIASGCVVNNWLDRKIDAKMERTKKRALVTGEVAVRDALIFAGVLGFCGVALLAVFASVLAAAIAALGWFFYVVVYSYWKRRSPLSTIVGSISGAVPPVVGYTAVTGQLDAAAAIIFATLVFWQMPHFYAIGIFRAKEYASAGLPILPLKRSTRLLKYSMLLYVMAFTVVSALLTTYEYTSAAYLVFMFVLGSAWLWLGVQGFRDGTDDTRWAKRMFGFSLIVLLGWSGAVIVDSLVYTGV